MASKRVLLTVFVITILLSILPFLTFLGQSDETRMFVWVYRFPKQENRKLVEGLSLMDVDGVFLSVSPLKLDRKRDTFEAEYFEKIVDFLRLAQSRKIEVHAIAAEEPTYTFPEKHETVLDRVDAILSFNRLNPSSRFAGLQLDVEPYALEEWKNGTWEERERLLEYHIELLSEVREEVQKSQQSVVLSTTVAWWYAESIAKGRISSSSIIEIARHTDWLVPLVYDVSRKQVPELAKKLEVFFVGSVIIGLRASDYKDYQALLDVIADFNRNLKSHEGLVGFSVFEYDQLSTMFRKSMSSFSASLSRIEALFGLRRSKQYIHTMLEEDVLSNHG